ncbi:TraI domain-containing protein [Mixta tenebrionis]|jgi:integrating conjugative element relaxase (TIGR03760 family)|uniref:Integrating conjugative element relaxase, PFGI-1 class n=2 Tax=Mixta TaxID=2100764 RepID=A0A6P1Q2P7_9GAMM|nr:MULTISPECIES: TraI domain-containing protein [Mixta]QHM72612.1 hypothetical protein C7M51_02930 [Mixta intestinalis]TPW38355.1 hypothetical protein FKM52_20430 [Mixta tenebrionis]
MFAKFKTFLSRAGDTVVPSPVRVAAPVGYFLPEKAVTLLNTPRRRECLKKIQESSSLPADVWQQLYLAPVNTLLERVQNVPATEEGIWAGAGGFGDLTLQFTSYAVRLAKGYMFPPGAAPEEQAAQGVAWQAVIFWEALFWHLPLLADIEGELESGVTWCPGISVPDRAYRFRFAKVPSDNYAQALSSLIASQLLPAGAAPWICCLPGGMENLSVALWNKQTVMPVIGEILQRAAGLAKSPGIFAVNKGGDLVSVSDLSPGTDISLVSEKDETVILPELSYESDKSICSGCDSAEMSPDILPSAFNLASDDNFTDVVDQQKEAFSDNGDDSEETETLLALFGDILPSASDEKNDETEIMTDMEVNSGVNQCEQYVDFVEVKNNEILNNRHSDEPAEKTLSPGEEFISWLTNGLVEEKISINKNDSRIHIVAGFAFLCVPGVFWLFLRETGKDYSREILQASFEKLRLHRVRRGERFTKARLYGTEERTGKYQRINGYLVKVVHIFKGVTPPESGLLFFPN